MSDPVDALFTAGLGDLIALESLFTEAERSSLSACYWATRAASICVPLFEGSPRYRHVRHVVFPVSGREEYFSAEGVRARHPLPPGVEDWSVPRRFGEYRGRPWRTSTFLTDPPEPLGGFDLPSRFVAVQHQTTLHASPAQRSLRDLDDREWGRILGRLEEGDLFAVVLNSADTGPPPKHPLVVDLVGRTTPAQALAVLRRAEGYWGIASWLCVAAAQLFGPDALWVKGPESWLKRNRHVYFAPHDPMNCAYLFDHLCHDRPAVRFTPEMRQLVMLKMRPWRGEVVAPGSLVEAHAHEAEVLIRTGQAEPYGPPPPAPAGDAGAGGGRQAVADPVKRRAVRRGGGTP